MKNIREFLDPTAYGNYRNIRAVSICFVVVGAIYALGGFAALSVKPPDPGSPPIPIVFCLILGLVGLSGFFGGFAALNGDPRWSTLT